MDRNTIRTPVHELYGQGKSPKQIAAIIGVPVQTVRELTRDIPKGILENGGVRAKRQCMPDFPERWINAINPIRRYYGHEPMELHIDQ